MTELSANAAVETVRKAMAVELPSNIAPVQRGTILVRHLESDPLQNYLLYLPKTPGPAQRVLFMLVRGEQASALDRAHLFTTLAREYGVTLVAPIFEMTRPLGSLAQERRRVHRTLVGILREVDELAQTRTRRISLFGCGAAVDLARQFCVGHASWVDRLALALPAEAGLAPGLAESPLPAPILPSLGHAHAAGHVDCIPTLVVLGSGHEHAADLPNQVWLGSTEPMGARLAVKSRFRVRAGSGAGHSPQQALSALMFRWLFSSAGRGQRAAPRR